MLPAAAILALLVVAATAAPPEIQLLINRVVDEDQSVNETIKIHATNDLIVMESSDIMEHNVTDVANKTAIEEEEERPRPRLSARALIHPLEAPPGKTDEKLNETRAEMDDAGRLIVHLPEEKNSTTEILVGNGNNTVDVHPGVVELSSHGGW